MYLMEVYINLNLAIKKTPVIPKNIISNMKNIADHIKIGKQEDAHEFLIYFLEAMRISSFKYTQTVNTTDINALYEDNLIFITPFCIFVLYKLFVKKYVDIPCV